MKGKIAKTHEEYFADAPEFAVPILEKIKKLVHDVIPDVEERIKWGALSYDHHGIVVSVGAFKKHVALRVWGAPQIPGAEKILTRIGRTEMGSIDFEKASDVKVSQLKPLIKKAAKLREQVKDGKRSRPKRAPAKPRPSMKAPDDFLTALKRKKGAKANFDGFAPGYQKEYILWITEAKREATREKRLKQAVEWIAEGKTRNWKYM